MSKAKDRERAQAGILVRNTEERIVKEEDKDFSDGWKCFLCNSPISKGEGGKLEAYAHKKPKFVINKEMGKMNNLLAGHDSRTSRICKKCYKDRVER